MILLFDFMTKFKLIKPFCKHGLPYLINAYPVNFEFKLGQRSRLQRFVKDSWVEEKDLILES